MIWFNYHKYLLAALIIEIFLPFQQFCRDRYLSYRQMADLLMNNDRYQKQNMDDMADPIVQYYPEIVDIRKSLNTGAFHPKLKLQALL